MKYKIVHLTPLNKQASHVELNKLCTEVVPISKIFV